MNNLLFSSFLSRATIAGTPTGGPRELNLVDPDEGHDLLFEVLTHPLGERVGPEDAVLSVLRDVTDLRRASRELERQVQRVRQAEIGATGERDRLNLILENVAATKALLERVRQTKRPLRITRFGKPVADIVPPSPEAGRNAWIGSMKNSMEILEDIVSPVIDEKEIEALRD